MMFYFKYLLFIVSCYMIHSGYVEQKTQNKSSSAKFAFGGALYIRVGQSEANEFLHLATEFAVKHILSEGEERKNYYISSSSVARVLYTHDGKTPFELKVLDPDTGQPRPGSLVWGMRSAFTLTFRPNIYNTTSPSTSHTRKHSFVIFQYWDEQFYVLEHTFTNSTNHLKGPTASYKITTAPAHGATLHKHGAAENNNSVTEKSIGVTEIEGEMGKDVISYATKTDGNAELQEESLCGSEGFSECYVSSVGICHCICKIIKTSLKSCRIIAMKTMFIDLFKKRCNLQSNISGSHDEHKDSDIASNSNFVAQSHQEDIPISVHSTTLNNSTFSLRILTFNIWNVNVVSGGEAAYKKRIEHLASLCRKANADIIGLQEVRFQEGKCGKLGPNQMKHLADLLPEYQYVFHPAQVQKTELPNLVMEGVAFMSRHPITAHQGLFLKQDFQDPADGHQRVLLYAAVQLPIVGKVHVFNTHLSLSHKARTISVLQAWGSMKIFSGPAFLMGDFNAEAHNIEVQFLDGRAELHGYRSTGLHDVWRLKHGPVNPGFTFNPCEKLFKRIDLIFMREDKSVSLSDVWIQDDKTRGDQAASDHLGLVADFVIRKT